MGHMKEWGDKARSMRRALKLNSIAPTRALPVGSAQGLAAQFSGPLEDTLCAEEGCLGTEGINKPLQKPCIDRICALPLCSPMSFKISSTVHVCMDCASLLHDYPPWSMH
jgi:hypothetical protein